MTDTFLRLLQEKDPEKIKIISEHMVNEIVCESLEKTVLKHINECCELHDMLITEVP